MITKRPRTTRFLAKRGSLHTIAARASLDWTLTLMLTSRGFGALLVGAGIAAGAYALASRSTAHAERAMPLMRVPVDNPLTAEKVRLGRWLFYDRRLSFNGAIACADCHRQAFGFADPRPHSVGGTGDLIPRNAMTLTNVAYNGRYTWSDRTVKTLEAQALVPLTGEHPLEMGIRRDEAGVLARLRTDEQYAMLFRAAFPDEPDPVSLTNAVKAIGSFERTLTSFDAPYDRFAAGDRRALSRSAQRGLRLFQSERLKCTRCHDGINFRMTPGHRTSETDDTVAYHNTGATADPGPFKAPTLRNIAVTAPYFHDGSARTLEEVLDRYASGGQPHPSKSPLITGFTISSRDKQAVVAFLESLTDRAFLTNPALSDPFVPSAPGSVLQDALVSGETGPAVVVLPDGQTPSGTIGGLAVGRTEITVADFRRFVDISGAHIGAGCQYHTVDQIWKMVDRADWTAPVFTQTATHPVTCVTFEDAQAYVAWLSRETGHRYRLPSEAEFDYFNRAGRDGTYAFDVARPGALCVNTNGADQSAGFAYAYACKDGYANTAPVASFPPNAFGLYDTTGNLWELTADCWQSDTMRTLRSLFGLTPRDGAARIAEPCNSLHIVRGGSYISSAANLMASKREVEGYRSTRTGFRVVRELSLPLQGVTSR